MATSDIRAAALELVRPVDGVRLDATPLQGLWMAEQYLRLTDSARALVEFTDGVLEPLTPPTDRHQSLLGSMFLALHAHIHPLGGTVFFAALRVRIRPGKFREPDLVLMRNAKDPRRQNRYWLGADLVVEVVSEDDPERDTVEKVADYAEARMPEYWIVNPIDQTITVLQLVDAAYQEHGVFRRDEIATSKLLTGFTVPVSAVFDAA